MMSPELSYRIALACEAVGRGVAVPEKLGVEPCEHCGRFRLVEVQCRCCEETGALPVEVANNRQVEDDC